MQQRLHGIVLIAALILALGSLAGGIFIGRGMMNFRMADRSVTVKGLAEKDVQADLAVWTIRFKAAGDGLVEVQASIERDRDTIVAFLKAQGIDAAAITIGRLDVTDMYAQQYRPENIGHRFIIAGSVGVRSDQVDLIAQLSQRTGELVRKGVILEGYSGPQYVFTQLNAIKPAMLALATANARAAAEQFAKDSGSRVGSIRRANQGVFRIMARDGIAGGNEAEQIQKKVRVVSTVDYELDG